jgi:UDP-3-O-[3-hydroxymyristoyl] N-acetylglucosamine deacetylase/3-hydroxyacyl-[acyl-carrier-protein] dehydratase
MKRQQRKTLAKPFTLSGKGLHSGTQTTIVVKPTDSAGIQFVRTDLEGSPIILADANAVVSTARATTIGKKEATVQCVEHLLSALVGLGVTDALVEIDGAEVPILDGSAKPFADAVVDSEVVDVDGDREPLIIRAPMDFVDEASGASYSLYPAEDFEATVLIDFDSKAVGQQYAAYKRQQGDYVSEIAGSRTFVFAHEVSSLLEAGLVKGGDLSNAIVISDDRITDEKLTSLAAAAGIEGVDPSSRGIINSDLMQWPNEPARHKLVDLIGDLALVGTTIQGKIVATRPGHTGNVALAKHLKKMLREQKKLRGLPTYDPTAEPLMDIEAVQAMLPHRYPFLMVDKIIEISAERVVGVKNITSNEQLFQGHFPGNAIFPGVLQMEALAQTGGILALSLQDEPGTWDTYFLKMENVKFKHKVRPGDTLILKMELMSPIRRGIVAMMGTAYVGDKIVSEGELTAQIVQRT